MLQHRTLILASLLSLFGCNDLPTSIEDGGVDGDDGQDGGSGPTGSGGGGAEGGGSSSNAGGAPGVGGAGSAGGGQAEGGSQPQPASFDLSVTSGSMELRSELEVPVTIVENGYVGSVNLSVSGLPGDITATFETPSITLDGSGQEQVMLTLTSRSNSVVGPHDFTVIGTVPTGSKSGAGVLTIAPVITIYVPLNLYGYADSPPDTTAFGDYPTVINGAGISQANPITVRFFNQDVIPHIIHANNPNQGFAHGDVNIPPSGFDPLERNITQAGTYDYYPHDLGSADIIGRIVIQ